MENVKSWATYFRRCYKTFLFRSASSFLPYSVTRQGDMAIERSTDDAIGLDSILDELKMEAEKKPSRILKVSVVGIGNVRSQLN